MSAIEFFALYVFVRLIVPFGGLLWLGEWVKSRQPRRYGTMR